MSNCCQVNHVWGDHNFLVCDYCQIQIPHFRGSDAEQQYALWEKEHQHTGAPCPGNVWVDKMK